MIATLKGIGCIVLIIIVLWVIKCITDWDGIMKDLDDD